MAGSAATIILYRAFQPRDEALFSHDVPTWQFHGQLRGFFLLDAEAVGYETDWAFSISRIESARYDPSEAGDVLGHVRDAKGFHAV